ncbi:flavin reductase family protein [Arthrobacter caoxuetaonis]|uniref:Flavin reductase family protein n=1 Tax=Arthrobacter caoxuetaonis TaxID=2886935 RepID=A0A9X1MEF6_9MICC|nr:flavin reductase family protein [Arthrobacter caoxuetaonis]MCC3297842.1 flavin reductase family protein [Arthrobacter caoxuetaonis]USQ55968.1 flavin reductase family protein [Arthrobacter caoxuetaonis]
MALETDLQPNALRQAFGRFPSGIAALCAEVDGAPQGIVASSFTVGVSMDPPLVMFAVQNTSRTWPVLRSAGRIGVSVLGSGHDGVCRQIASRDGDRFAGLDLHNAGSGALFLDEAALWLETSVENEVPAGDHAVVLLRVHGYSAHGDAYEPLVFHGSAFRNLAVPAFA